MFFYKIHCYLLTSICILTSSLVYSDTNLNIEIFISSVTPAPTPPTCSFSTPSGGATLDFGTVYWQDITGDTYKRTIDTKLVCSNLTKNTVSLKVKPQVGIASFNSNASATSNKDLGILFHNTSTGTALNLDTNYTVNSSAVALSATLIKNTNTTVGSVTAGSFNAYSLFEVVYE